MALDVEELCDIAYISQRAGSLLMNVFGADWLNFQENGNWARPGHNHMHIHVYARRTTSRLQPFGEALRFPKRKNRFDWFVPGFTATEVETARRFFTSTDQNSVRDRIE